MGVFLNQKPVTPIPSVPVATFLESSIEEMEVPVYNETGKVVNKVIERRVVRKTIPRSVLENEGLSCEMFTVENLQRAGIDVTKQNPITKPLYRGSLDGISAAYDILNDETYLSNLEKDLTNE